MFILSLFTDNAFNTEKTKKLMNMANVCVSVTRMSSHTSVMCRESVFALAVHSPSPTSSVSRLVDVEQKAYITPHSVSGSTRYL
jgi:hypothetical protein